MRHNTSIRDCNLLTFSVVLAFGGVNLACGGGAKSTAPTESETTTTVTTTTDKEVTYAMVEDFNKHAMYQNAAMFFVGDLNSNGLMDKDEVKHTLFVNPEARSFADVYAAIKADAELEVGSRRTLLRKELDQGIATLVHNDLTGLSESEKKLVRAITTAARHVETIYGDQVGLAHAKTKLADDPESRAVLARNWTHRCIGPQTENDLSCTAAPGLDNQIFGVYSEEIQKTEKFCERLAKHPKQEELLSPFTAVSGDWENLKAVPYAEKYKTTSRLVVAALEEAAEAAGEAGEKTLKTYLTAAASGFKTNDWDPANEAWAAMNVNNSKWYVRVGPDEVYWDPCSRKAGYHLTFARINRDSLEWQDKLKPLQEKMEKSLETLSAKKYRARSVTFHLPDFIDIVFNAGDDRKAFGATIGQSLPNWGPVANEGRGRTVAMTNLYGDADSLQRANERAATLFDTKTLAHFGKSKIGGLLSTILHEATHNLGPAHEYTYRKRTQSTKWRTLLRLLRLLADRSPRCSRNSKHKVAHSIIWRSCKKKV